MKKENGKMRHEQRLYPDVVYRFNDIFQTVWQNHRMGSTDGNTDDVLVTPVFFSKGSRTFHWIGLDSHMWNWEERLCREHLTQFIEAIKTLKSSKEGLAAWELFCENQPSMKVYKESIKTINEAVCGNNTNQEQIHRAILLLYSGFHHDAEKNIEGVFYNFLTTCSNHGDIDRSNYLEGELLGGPPFEKFKLKDPCSALTSGKCKERDCLVKKSDEIDIINKVSPNLLVIFRTFVEHLLWHTSRSDGDDTFGKKIIDKNQVALLPLYDVWIGDRGYGGIKAVFIVFFDKDKGKAKPRQAWFEKTFSTLRDAFQELAEEVTASAETLAASAPISPPYDLVRHFLKALVYVQDWQSAAVFHNDGTFQSGYKRTRKDLQGTWAWEKRKNTDFDQYVTVPCDANYPIQECNGKKGNSKRYYMWWTAGKNNTINLWSKEFLSDLSDEEVSRFGNLSIRFEFPEATHIPSSEADRKLLYQEYLRQQLDLMRMLIPKVRARRAALRSAVSAIMGRNMSHNIGSHVLARYSSAIKHDLDPANKDNTDHRTDFLSYLQRRMDFLAEVATSDKAFWEQPLSLHESINKLNLKEQQDRIKADEPCSATCSQSPTTPGTLACSRLKTPPGAKKNKPILLSYITGKESLVANVEWGNPPDSGKEQSPENALYFSCPGGEVGVHALYVILENIIRNSARHAQSDEPVDVYVAVDENDDSDKLIKLTIIDPRTELNKDGWVMESNERIGRESLTAHINEILTKEPFLNEDGSTNPKYWGVREMQICAHYLRGLPLGDLEGKAAPLPVLEAKSWYVEGSVEEYYLSYTLYLKRAQLLAYIETSPQLDNNEDRDKKLLSRGIKPIYRDKVNKKDNENKEIEIDWLKIADESRGYSFLVLPPGLMSEYENKLRLEAEVNCTSEPPQLSEQINGASETQLNECIKHELPVRVVAMASGDIKTLVEKTGGGFDLRLLHEGMIKKYRTNGTDKSSRWGVGEIFAVAAWFNIELDDKVSDNFNNGIHYCPVNISSHDENNKPFSKLPDELPVLENGDEIKHLGLAWLDHANDTDLMWTSGGNPRSASFSVGGPRNWASVEPLWSDSPHRQVLIDHLPDGMSELISAALARVVVLDERIQSRRHDIVRAVTLYKYWPQAGIWCPLHPDDDARTKNDKGRERETIAQNDAYHDIANACNLDEPDFAKIQDLLNNPTRVTWQLPADFLVLHLTILERLNKQRPEESINTTLFKLVHGTKCEYAQIIIVTGRGVPTVARHREGEARIDARYLPISALQEFLVTRPSKLGLMRVLWAAAAPSKQS